MLRLLTFLLLLAASTAQATVTISGELKQWHTVTLAITGPPSSETGNPNPFTDYRLDVTFTSGPKSYKVPGYFAADGDAANTGATSGNIWLVHFTPDSVGTWSYTVSFKTGSMVATTSTFVVAGVSTVSDGSSGAFTVAPSNKSAPDFRARGRVVYRGTRYLQYPDGGIFLKTGADSPENFLGYYEFDNTTDHGGANTDLNGTATYTSQGNTYTYHGDGLHHFDAHLGDWTPGSPTWQGGKGRRIIGALNYLASSGANSISFLTMNINGDGREVYPYVTYNGAAVAGSDRLRFDCSKLAQWGIVFDHAQQMGLHIHMKLQEIENDDLLDGGNLFNERKIYYRELIARFGHALALEWNLGEEYDAYLVLNDPNQNVLRTLAQNFYEVDPYRHPVVVHTWPTSLNAVYTPMLGTTSRLTGASLQRNYDQHHASAVEWINKANTAGKPWVVCADEQGPANDGLQPYGGNNDNLRKYTLWGNLMAGGGGVAYYFGYNFDHSDLDCEDWRSRSAAWITAAHARALLDTLPLRNLSSANALVNNGGNSNSRYCLAWPGKLYVVYLPSGGSTTLNLSGQTGTYTVRWYDPRNGGPLQTGTVASVAGGSAVSIGNPPNNTGQDWAAVVALYVAPPLPVIFGEMSARVFGANVVIDWVTEIEQNAQRFDIVRSLDVADWQPVGTVAAVGESQHPTAYTYTDRNLPAGRYYYRLHQFDFNGQIEASRILEAIVSPSATELHTRQAPGGLWATITGRADALELWTITGQRLTRIAMADQQQVFIPAVPGVYVVRALDGGAFFTQKVNVYE